MIEAILKWWRNGVKEFHAERARLGRINVQRSKGVAMRKGWIYPTQERSRQPCGNRRRIVEVELRSGLRVFAPVKELFWGGRLGPETIIRWRETGTFSILEAKRFGQHD